jgi:hypothetical protein
MSIVRWLVCGGTLPAVLVAASCAYHTTANEPMLGAAPLTWTFQIEPAPEPAPKSDASSVISAGPPALGRPEALPPPAANLTGSYSGQAINTYAGGFGTHCTDIQINRSFVVKGQQVTFFAFRGTIAADGRLVMQAGDRWISGRFIGRTFQGELLQKGPSCSWNLKLVAE